MKLKPVSFEKTCPTIQYSFQIATSAPNTIHRTLVAKFSGKYRDGSKGNPDAAFMRGVLQTACRLWWHTAVIIDLSDLEYHWGDRIEMLFNPLENAILAIVVGPKCRKALSTLVFGLDTDRDITEHKQFFDSLEQAFEYTQKLIVKKFAT
jgi:hypothetical protein